MATNSTTVNIYSVVFKAEDGEHTATLEYTKWDDQRAEYWARKTFDKPDEGIKFVSIERTTLEEHQKLMAKNLAENPTRVPIDEKTGGQPNRALSDPKLLAKDG